ncbi:MAG: hemin-degrading factor [Gammaproteobacteria bacterium]
MNEVLSMGRPWDLAHAWERLRAEEPGVRARDAAQRLGASEAELVASACGANAVRLEPNFGALVAGLSGLGDVMALTRNEHAVHEKTGRYENLQIGAAFGLVLGAEIDLRLFFRRWRYGFAVTESGRHGSRRSLQFFDVHGTAVHKVYLTERSDVAAYERLIAEHRNPDQAPRIAVDPRPRRTPSPIVSVDRALLRGAWSALRDTHEFYGMLKRLGITRLRALSAVGTDLATPVACNGLWRLLQVVRDAELTIMVFVTSPGVLQIHTGPVANLRVTGPWHNVLDARFNLHVRETAIADAFVVRKPTTDGIVTSLEVFDDDEDLVVQVFGKRKPGQPECARWRHIVEGLCGEPLSA